MIVVSFGLQSLVRGEERRGGEEKGMGEKERREGEQGRDNLF